MSSEPGAAAKHAPNRIGVYLKVAAAGYVVFLVVNLLLTSLLLPPGTRGTFGANLITVGALVAGVVLSGRAFAIRGRSQWIRATAVAVAFAVLVTEAVMLVGRLVVP